MIMERNFAPVIVFSFSKKDCEAYATTMSKLDFNTGQYLLLYVNVIWTSEAFSYAAPVIRDS